MDMTANNVLSTISKKLCVNVGSDEEHVIRVDKNRFELNLYSFFGDHLSHIRTYGSFTDGTMINRKYYKTSSVDLLAIFNLSSKTYPPDVYSQFLQSYAKVKYPGKKVIQSKDSVILDTGNVIYNIRPGLIPHQKSQMKHNIMVPGDNNSWVENTLTLPETTKKMNSKNLSVKQQLIRLLKYWNISHNYPYKSLEIKSFVADYRLSSGSLTENLYYLAQDLPAPSSQSGIGSCLKILKAGTQLLKDIEAKHESDPTRIYNVMNMLFPRIV